MNEHYKHQLHQGAPARPPLWTRDFILVTAINSLLFLGFQSYPSALPPYAKALGASDSALGWLTAVATIATLITRPMAGIMLDTLGRRNVLLSGLLLMTVVSGVLYFFPIVAAIIFLRFIHGLGWGVAGTAISTIAADYVPKIRFGEGMGFFSLAASVGMAVSPAIALSLSPGHMFAIGTLFMASATLLALFLNYKPLEKHDGVKWKNPYEKAAALPAMVIFMISTAFGATMTFLAVYAAGRGIGNIGPFFTVYAGIMMITRPSTGRIVDRHGFNVIVPVGMITLAISLAMLSRSASMPMFLLSAAFYGFGQGIVFTGMQTLAILSSPHNRVGAATATFFTGFDAGIGFGAVIGGVLAGSLGYANMFLCLTLCPVMAAIIFIVSLRAAKTRR